MNGRGVMSKGRAYLDGGKTGNPCPAGAASSFKGNEQGRSMSIRISFDKHASNLTAVNERITGDMNALHARSVLISEGKFKPFDMSARDAFNEYNDAHIKLISLANKSIKHNYASDGPVNDVKNTYSEIEISELEKRISEIEKKFDSSNNDSNKLTSCFDYSTPWLKVLDEAILKFFSPRHEVDPKKEEVVEYIEKRAQEEGISDPASIAKSVFTIIKPHDHNPKKRRIFAKGMTH